eukprot:scaffold16242_cov55-Attheya_sp.AAC.12
MTLHRSYAHPDTFMNNLQVEYVAKCVNVTVDPNSCVMQKVIDLTSESNDQEQDNAGCDVPNLNEEQIDDVVFEAKQLCMESNVETPEDIAIKTMLGDQDCMQSLCMENIETILIFNYMETCAEVDLPSQLLTTPDTMMGLKQMEHNMMLTCMLDYALSTPKIQFGLDEHSTDSEENCYPPGYSEIESFCPTTLAPMAVEHCMDQIPHIPDDTMQSMSYSYGGDMFSLSYNYGDGHDDEEKEIFQTDFCIIMEQLSSETGRECFLPMCEIAVSDTEPPSSAPTINDSSAPTIFTTPTRTPTSTDAPTLSPTLSPTAQPTANANGKVTIGFDAGVKISGLTVTDIPLTGLQFDAVVEVIKTVFETEIPDNAVSELLTIGDINVGRSRTRLLTQAVEAPGSVDIKFRITIEEECDSATCEEADQMVDDFYEATTNTLRVAVETGKLTEKLQSEAKAKGIELFETVVIDTESFSADQPVKQVTIGGDNNGVTSAGIVNYANTLLSSVAIALIVANLMF